MTSVLLNYGTQLKDRNSCESRSFNKKNVQNNLGIVWTILKRGEAVLMD